MKPREIWASSFLAAAIAVAWQPAAAASCMDDVQRVAQRLGVQERPASPGAPAPAEAPATTESRGIPPEVTSRLTGSGTPPGATAGPRSEALASLQAARAANAQGNESECLAQLAKARAALEGK